MPLPQAIFVFIPSVQAGKASSDNLVERGLDKTGIKIIGSRGDVTDDQLHPSMGDRHVGNGDGAIPIRLLIRRRLT